MSKAIRLTGSSFARSLIQWVVGDRKIVSKHASVKAYLESFVEPSLEYRMELALETKLQRSTDDFLKASKEFEADKARFLEKCDAFVTGSVSSFGIYVLGRLVIGDGKQSIGMSEEEVAQTLQSLKDNEDLKLDVTGVKQDVTDVKDRVAVLEKGGIFSTLYRLIFGR